MYARLFPSYSPIKWPVTHWAGENTGSLSGLKVQKLQSFLMEKQAQASAEGRWALHWGLERAGVREKVQERKQVS